MAVLYKLLVLSILTILGHIGPRPCLAQCSEGSFICNIDLINMTSDGGAKIRNIIDSDTESYIMSIVIEKLIVSSSVAGPFLQRIASLTDTISYLVYREPVFQVPEGNTISDIEIINAGNLRSLVAGKNRHLKRLSVESCMLDRIPPSLGQLVVLEGLFIMNCALTALRLDVFANSPSLVVVSLAGNQIRQLFAFTSPPKQRLIITHLDLASNQLERLDMSLFAHMPDLQRLEVEGNRIVRLEATIPTTCESLVRLGVNRNKISSIDTRNLTLPLLSSLYVDDNALSEIPTLLGPMPKLHYLGFERNNLKQVDLSVLRRFENLTGIFLNENKIDTVRTSSPFTLPALEIMLFENNQIVSTNFTGCNFPELYLLSFLNNKLTAVPPVFQRFAKARISVEWNPIKCANLATHKSRYVEGRIYLSSGKTQADCLTTSMIELKENVKGCCVA